MLFNVFITDLFIFFKIKVLTNYADDNTFSYGNINFQIVKVHLEREAKNAPGGWQ